MSNGDTAMIMGALRRLETQLGEGLGDLGGRVDRLGERVDRLGGRVDRLGECLDTTRVEIMARLDRLQDQVGTVRDEGFVSMTTAQRAEDTVRKEIAHLSKIVAALHRMVHSIDGRLANLEKA
ncbi:MAG: hypothetical protein JO212_00690 [Acetobacteraceae bacterium]|nr:hypothetical protein [Acetobacteraceae bacterium]